VNSKPCTKVAYNTAKNARAAAQRVKGRTQSPLREYHCPSCGRWHLTSQLHRPERTSTPRNVLRGRKGQGLTMEELRELAASMRPAGTSDSLPKVDTPR